MSRYFQTITAACVVVLTACSEPADVQQNLQQQEVTAAMPVSLNILAEQYVKLALAFGTVDANFVDAYTGPALWRDEATEAALPLSEQLDAAQRLSSSLDSMQAQAGEEARLAQLRKNVRAMTTRMRMAGGEHFSFNEEAQLLYDAVPPAYDVADFAAALAELETLLPGAGTLGERLETLRERLYVPADKVPAVMAAAIAECRKRTLAHYTLPANERFDLEFVTDKPWSAYNWYQGDNHSLIQVNLDQPFLITRAVDLGCHEGYPGHHVWNLYVENTFIKARGWLEYQVFPLFAPGGLFGEGSANYGIELAFPGTSRLAFEQDVLYPLAGLAVEDGNALEAVRTALDKLAAARTYIGRAYLDGEISREDAVSLTMQYQLIPASRAQQTMDFTETYRAYIINYTLGQDLVRAYVERHANSDSERWAVFEQLLLRPTSAGDLLQ